MNPGRVNGERSVVAAALLAAALIGACSRGAREKPAGQDSAGTGRAAAPGVESTRTAAAPAQDGPQAEVKTYLFHATPTAIDSVARTLTVKHEPIGDYRPAGTSTFTVADPALLKQVTVGRETHVTLRVAGERALVVKVNAGHEKGQEH
ncbi:MAG TPA: copper-binding protein [Candidatus Kapabacteria bacterium]|nr:copper-binding protein [Candidatus Kapabacteria bacterium]